LVASALATTADEDTVRGATKLVVRDAAPAPNDPEDIANTKSHYPSQKERNALQIWVGHGHRQHASGDRAWAGERRPDVWAHYSLTIAACNLTHMRTLGEGRPKAIL
jgi:hypothetical protein